MEAVEKDGGRMDLTEIKDAIKAQLHSRAYRHFLSDTVLRGVGIQVEQIRKARGWTQAQLAGRAGLSLPLINRIERGDILHVHIASLRKIATAFDCALRVEFAGFDMLIDEFLQLLLAPDTKVPSPFEQEFPR